MKTKQVRLLIVCLALICVFTICDKEAQAKASFKGEVLVVQVWGGSYENTLKEHVIKPFEKATGATVELVLGVAPVAKLKAEGKHASVDVMHIDPAEASTAIEMGVLAPFNFENIPNAADLYPQAIQNIYTIVTNWGSFGITYRNDAVDPAPASWTDLWSDKFKGKVAIWEIENAGTIEMMDMVARSMGSTITDKNCWDAVFKKMAELKPNIGSFVSSHAELETLLTSGDISMCVGPNGRAIRMIKQGQPIGFAAPKEGCPTMTSMVGIAAGSQNKKLAEIFVDYCLNPKAQEAFAANNYYAPSNSKAVVPQDLQSLMPYGMAQVSALVTIDQKKLVQVKNQLVERWNKEMK